MTDNPLKPLAHAGDFSNAAAVYDGARPEYKAEWIERIFQEANIQPGAVIAEIGAGTGGLSRVILQNPKVGKLYCIEPDPEMRNTLRKNLADSIAAGKVEVIEGRAEQTNLPDGVRPALFMGGDMAHWVLAPEKATQEFRDKLQPGGKAAFIVRYPDGDSPVVRKLHELLEQHSHVYGAEDANKLMNEEGPRLEAKQGKHLIAAEGGTVIKQPLPQMRSKEELFNYLQSRSSTTTYCKPPRMTDEGDDEYQGRLLGAKANAYAQVIDPLFDFAREQGLTTQDGGVEKIELTRVLHIMVGSPREYALKRDPLVPDGTGWSAKKS